MPDFNMLANISNDKIDRMASDVEYVISNLIRNVLSCIDMYYSCKSTEMLNRDLYRKVRYLLEQTASYRTVFRSLKNQLRNVLSEVDSTRQAKYKSLCNKDNDMKKVHISHLICLEEMITSHEDIFL